MNQRPAPSPPHPLARRRRQVCQESAPALLAAGAGLAPRRLRVRSDAAAETLLRGGAVPWAAAFAFAGHHAAPPPSPPPPAGGIILELEVSRMGSGGGNDDDGGGGGGARGLGRVVLTGVVTSGGQVTFRRGRLRRRPVNPVQAAQRRARTRTYANAPSLLRTCTHTHARPQPPPAHAARAHQGPRAWS
jgi:hypothetical protein